jgi:hypothetical protein
MDYPYNKSDLTEIELVLLDFDGVRIVNTVIVDQDGKESVSELG